MAALLGEKTGPFTLPVRTTEHRSLVTHWDCHLPGDTAGTGLMGQPNEDDDGVGSCREGSGLCWGHSWAKKQPRSVWPV